jgi:S-disulfanyl-L-cysteine oxidoreductase SoxD
MSRRERRHPPQKSGRRPAKTRRASAPDSSRRGRSSLAALALLIALPLLIVAIVIALDARGEGTAESPTTTVPADRSTGVSIPDDDQAVAQGQDLYDEHCASCHGAELEGQPDWQALLPEGGRPAPPHDETGHTWHHEDEWLFEVTKRGGQATEVREGYNNGMPAFGDVLGDDEILAVLAYVKSRWPEDIRASQEEVDRQSRGG